MPIDEKRTVKVQNIILENRSKLNVSGVVDVLNFDEQIITLETELGILIVKGSNLRLNKFNLDSTDLSVDGEIESLNYDDRAKNGKGEGLFTKIFK